MTTQITRLMDEIRAAAASLQINNATIAEICGLHKNSTLRLWDASWHPRTDTVEKLERLLHLTENDLPPSHRRRPMNRKAQRNT